MSPNPPEVIIVTGMSGAGRSLAGDTLGDLGWYVVDNLPPQMIEEMISIVSAEGYRRLAAIVDIRGGRFFPELTNVLDNLKRGGNVVSVVLLEANDETLVRRFEQGRRPHPWQSDGTLTEAIAKERETLADLRAGADLVIDTSNYTPPEFADRLVSELNSEDMAGLKVNVQSFGHKHGVPADADFLADVRFLANPHWNPELRPLTGLDEAVRENVLNAEGTAAFLDSYTAAILVALERYRAHDKHFVTIAVGCTGGKHRSVAVAEELSARIRDAGYEVRTHHRDRERHT